ncbi:hypothetical protein IIY66_00925 [Candidatus Saccharibacteria bacterium]|nr:hypothetical protein [Candidatus Saccharibacteria bacterium]
MPNNIQEKITKTNMDPDAFQVFDGETDYSVPDEISTAAIEGLHRWRKQHKHELAA